MCLLLRLVLILTAGAASADEALTGVWDILRIGRMDIASHGPDLNRLAIEKDRLFGRLTCAAISARLEDGRIAGETVELQSEKCPAEEAGRAAILAALLSHPGMETRQEGDSLLLALPGSAAVALRLVPGTAGPGGPLADVLGDWIVETLDGRPPLPASEPGRVPGVRFDPFVVSAYSGCNGGGTGIAWREGGYLAEGPFLATEMGCPLLMDQEMRLFTILADTPRLTLRGTRLEVDGAGGGRMILVRPEPGGPLPWP